MTSRSGIVAATEEVPQAAESLDGFWLLVSSPPRSGSTVCAPSLTLGAKTRHPRTLRETADDDLKRTPRAPHETELHAWFVGLDCGVETQHPVVAYSTRSGM